MVRYYVTSLTQKHEDVIQELGEAEPAKFGRGSVSID
jgi:hypothetical protein